MPTLGPTSLQHRHVANEIALMRRGKNLFGIVALLESFDFAAQKNGQSEIALSGLINQITATSRGVVRPRARAERAGDHSVSETRHFPYRDKTVRPVARQSFHTVYAACRTSKPERDTLSRDSRLSHTVEEAAVSAAIREQIFPATGAVSGSDRKNLRFFEMSAQKIFRKGEPNRVNQPKLT